ncbi:MAG: FKBP-type peptidyl-prolyl cis-trans isomerase, partial [Desulfobacterales bacterium]
MSTAKTGDTVKVHYTGRLDDDTVFDTSRGKTPLQFT